MIICFRCDRATKDLLDALRLQAGATDYGELMHEALTTYHLLLEQTAQTGSMVFADSDGHGGSDFPIFRRAGQAKGTPERIVGEVPDLFRLPTERFPGCPVQAKEATGVTSAGNWIFGQLNRLLPAKAACRALANLSLRNGPAVPISVASEIAETAASLGDVLRQHDNAMSVPRDDRFATAFPTEGPEGEKGRLRFATQFVAYADGQGELAGLPAELQLIAPAAGQEGDTGVSLTSAGWELALLPNPALDATASAITRLGVEERDFLRRHIAGFVPHELDAYCTLLQAIVNGSNTPTALDTVAGTTVLPHVLERLSASYLSTQRSGAISRMSDLNLVRRERSGSRVLYRATDSGQSFLLQHCP